MEYRCGQLSWYDRNTRRSSAAQWRLTPPAVRGIESTSAAPLDQAMCVAACGPFVVLLTKMDHGCGCCVSVEPGVPPRPGCRTNASAWLSGDHSGVESRDVVASM